MVFYLLNDQTVIYQLIAPVQLEKMVNIASIDLNILEGLTSGIVSNNLDDVKIIQSWLQGTDVEKSLNQMCELEVEVDR